MKVGIVSQYTEVYCNCGVRARLDCIAIQWPAKPQYNKGWAAGARARGAGLAGQACRRSAGARRQQGRAGAGAEACEARAERSGRAGAGARR